MRESVFLDLEDMNTPPPLPKTPGLAVASLVLGISGIALCLGAVAGVPAIICGHLAKAKIRRTGSSGEGIAVAGLVLGYVSSVMTFFVFPMVAALAIPAFVGAEQKAHAAAMLNNARQIGSAIEAAGLIRVGTPPHPETGYPADAGIRSAGQVAQMLVAAECLTQKEVTALGFQQFEIGNVAERDPADTILIRSKPDTGNRYAVVVLKNGEARILRTGHDTGFGKLPPRDPAFLKP